MKDKMLLFAAGYLENMESGDTYGSLVAMPFTPTVQARGLFGMEPQKISCLPEVSDRLIKTAKLPAVCEVSLSMRGAIGKKASLYATDAHPDESTASAFPEFLAKVFGLVTDKLAFEGQGVLCERYLVLSASHVTIAQSRQSFGKLHVVSLQPPDPVAGRAGHDVQTLSAEPVLVQSLGRTNLLPCIVDLSFVTRQSAGKSHFYAAEAKAYDKTAGKFQEFFKGLKAGAGRADDRRSKHHSAGPEQPSA